MCLLTFLVNTALQLMHFILVVRRKKIPNDLAWGPQEQPVWGSVTAPTLLVHLCSQVAHPRLPAQLGLSPQGLLKSHLDRHKISCSQSGAPVVQPQHAALKGGGRRSFTCTTE